MIRYRLRCRKAHEFESWFASSDAFERLAAKKQVVCPACGSRSVEKALMAPGVVKSDGKSASKRAAKAAAQRRANVPAAQEQATPGEVQHAAALTDAQKELVSMVRKLREEVASQAEYVGRRFPEEARKIHYEETQARGIYGEATVEEARALLEEGVDVLPLPALPEDQN